MTGLCRRLPADIRELLHSQPALRAVLLTDFLVRLAELSALVILPWWITSSGGTSAIAAFGVTLAVATFIAAPAVSPFGDRLCKGRQITGGLAGLCLGALSTGVLLGSLFGSQALVDRFGRYRARVGLGLAEGLALAVVGLAASPWLVLPGLAAAGFCNAAMGLVGATHRALAIPQAYRVRLFAAGAMTTQVAGAIGPALVGMALLRHDVATVYTAWGLLMALCVLGLLAVPRLKEFLSLGHDEIVDWYRLQYPAIFK